VEEKDRLHSLNHFTHVKKSNPEEAKLIQSQVIEHMKVIDERINQSLDMLHHFPKVESKLKPQVGKKSGQGCKFKEVWTMSHKCKNC
jgi:hypothetical protein